MRPDLIVERVGGLYILTGETVKGKEWLEAKAAAAGCQRLGNSLGVDEEVAARDLIDSALADGLDVME